MNKYELFVVIIRLTFYVMFAIFSGYMIVSQTMSGIYLYPTWILVIILILVILATIGEVYCLIKNRKRDKGNDI